MEDKFFNKFKKISFSNDLRNLSIGPINSILIIGGAGTIGSNYIKCILQYKPKNIIVVDINENALTELTRDLRSSVLLDYNPNYITYPVNLLSDTFNKIFKLFTWDVIANFSAHKHVRSEKDFISIEALIKNNVFGCIKLLKLCEKNPPKYFFSVSTDKAANPVNIMGASKSLMEKLILSRKNKFRVSTARFANVAFSNGSLLEGFINRINNKQPLSCPKDIKRFFVSPKQSGQICLLSTFLGDSGYIFFPKLDFESDQIFFKDIAIDFLHYKKYLPEFSKSEKEAKEFDIESNFPRYPLYLFNTDTSGEKKYEEFYSENEKYNLNTYQSLGYIKSSVVKISFENVINDFNSVFKNPNSSKDDIISTIKKYVLDFEHIELGKHLDQKM